MPLPAAGQKPTGAMMRALLAALLSDCSATATVATAQTTTSTAYTDLATVGPSVTLTSTGTIALVFLTFQGDNSTPANGGAASVVVSGATTLAAHDDRALGHNVGATGFGFYAGSFIPITINPGTNTFKMQYRVAGTTGNFARRKLFVIAP